MPRYCSSFRLLIRVFGLLCFLCAVPSLPAATRNLIFFGDSMTAGYGLDDPSSEAYPALIQEKIDAANLPWRVVNAGLSGETSAGGLRRVDWILRQPVDVFVLALGANDALRGIDPASTRSNLERILERVRTKNPAAKLVIAGIFNEDVIGLGNDFTRQFGRIFPDVAAKQNATLIPFMLEGVGGQRQFNQPDRIHPNNRGHAMIAETVWKVLRPLL